MAMDRRKSTDSLIPNDKMLSTHNGSVRRICCDRELWNQIRCSVIHFKNSSLEVKRMNVHYIVIDISAWKNYSMLEQITRRSCELLWIFFWKESGNKIFSWPSMTSNFLNFPVKKARELPYSTLIYLRLFKIYYQACIYSLLFEIFTPYWDGSTEYPGWILWTTGNSNQTAYSTELSKLLAAYSLVWQIWLDSWRNPCAKHSHG